MKALVFVLALVALMSACTPDCTTITEVHLPNELVREDVLYPSPIAAKRMRTSHSFFGEDRVVISTTRCENRRTVDTVAHYAINAEVYLCTPKGCKVQPSVEVAKLRAGVEPVAHIYQRTTTSESIRSQLLEKGLATSTYESTYHWKLVYTIRR